jgi:hypothetical protein
MADMTDAKRVTNKWSRLIHVYTSMAALLLVLLKSPKVLDKIVVHLVNSFSQSSSG